MANQNGQPTPDQATIVKGKSPRNALLGVGAIAALAIGAIGFYYQVKASNEAAEEQRLLKASKAADGVDKSNNTEDVDKIIADQQAAARRAEAIAKANAASTPRADVSKPSLSLDGFVNDQKVSKLSADAKEDAIYVSPIFRPGVKIKDQSAQASASGPAGLLTPQQMALQQAAAQQAAMGAANAQAAALAGKFGAQAAAAPVSSQARDNQFLSDAKTQSASGEGFLSAGFVGQSRGCTLTPPHHIPVLTIEALNSDRPGTASLVVDEDVYDSIRGDCLMIPKGTTITAPYASDIQPGQESILVAATEMRLPNGKQVPLYGAQGADTNGWTGFSGDVNNHFLKIYGTSFLTAILLRKFNGGDSSTTTGPLGVTQVGSTAGQVAATTAQSVLSRYQNIPPTITTDWGKRFMIKVNREIHLEPYRD
ncbi:TrbI/VirB10 family protein (plasmid) [Paraburkholderia sp. D15]|uniref:TrbI/VirB10 family protein n=1 Tax=Paraburkholderia sp. D15 TaxID=2880218 RepID=UPI00247A2D87|nr:TrbI/VirB10 family protein [Paraburkholderia sp. D15]WGS55278.1 TrbI/VirB10 family protein [Paraburkholderia sp. D15]